MPKRNVLPKQPYEKLPLTTTASDTNIPINNNNNNLFENNEIKSYNSCHSIDNNTIITNNNNSCSVDSLKKKSNPDLKESNTKSSFNNKNKNQVVYRTDKERLFKRRDEGYMSGTRWRQLKKKNNLSENSGRQSLDKERSSSMSRLLDE